MEQLSRILERPASAIQKQANKLGVTRRFPTSLTSDILHAAEQPNGMRLADIEGGYKKDSVWKRAEVLVKERKLFKVEISHKHVRYFADEQLAGFARLKAQPKVLSNGVTIRSSRSKVGWGRDDPMHETAKTKYTYAEPLPKKVFWTNTHPRY
jgi:hypothetical protein